MNSPALIGRSLAGQRLDAAALDRGLADAVLVAERIEVARLRAEVLRRSARVTPGKSLVLLAAPSSRVRRHFSSESLKTLTPMWT